MDNKSLRRTLSQKSVRPHHSANSNINKNASTNNLTILNNFFQPEDLEWDKHGDFVFFNESETFSAYDINERMSQLFNKLENDFISTTNSNISISASAYTTDTDSLLFSPAEPFTIEDLFKTKLLALDYCSRSLSHCSDYIYKPFVYHPITFDFGSDQPVSRELKTFYRSMPDLRMMDTYKKKLLDCEVISKTKHVSLLDLDYLELIDFSQLRRSLKKRGSLKLNLTSKYEQPIEIIKENPIARKVSHCGSSVNFSRLGRFTKLRCYVNDISKKIVSAITGSFNRSMQESNTSQSLCTISEETVGTYDIIEIDDILVTPSCENRIG